MICPRCALEIPPDDSFCEGCGQRVDVTSPGAVVCACGSSEGLDDDGFCLGCGRRVLRPRSDHVELALNERLAAVSDRGQVHDRNEDRFALERVGDACVLVVCDGVSSTRDAEQASEIAAGVLVEALSRRLREDAGADLQQAFAEAFQEASAALERAVVRRSEDAPSTTAVVAVLRGEEIVLAWMGDSRAYWITEVEALLLTRDHSWLHEVVEAGEMERSDALRSPHAHAITRWLGADAAWESGPEVARFAPDQPGSVLLCSDGLWNYFDEPAALYRAFQQCSSGAHSAAEVVRSMVRRANQSGGQDNITAALLMVNAGGRDLAGEN